MSTGAGMSHSNNKIPCSTVKHITVVGNKGGLCICNGGTGKLWNSLPLHIRCSFLMLVFKSTLNTHLFSSAFGKT